MTKPFEILLVEDSEGDVQIFRRALRDITPACKLSVAVDGVSALDYLFKRADYQNVATPHVVFLDLNLPGISGKEALAAMKNDERVKDIPVVVFTSSESPSDIQESYALHANCYVIKRFDMQESKNTIKNVVSFWRDLAALPYEAARP